jgi:hypothetical protein
MKEKKEPMYFKMTALGMAAIPSVGPSPMLVKVFVKTSLTTSARPMGQGAFPRLLQHLLMRKSKKDGWHTQSPSPCIGNPQSSNAVFDLPIETLLLRKVLLPGFDQIGFV